MLFVYISPSPRAESWPGPAQWQCPKTSPTCHERTSAAGILCIFRIRSIRKDSFCCSTRSCQVVLADENRLAYTVLVMWSWPRVSWPSQIVLSQPQRNQYSEHSRRSGFKLSDDDSWPLKVAGGGCRKKKQNPEGAKRKLEKRRSHQHPHRQKGYHVSKALAIVSVC